MTEHRGSISCGESCQAGNTPCELLSHKGSGISNVRRMNTVVTIHETSPARVERECHVRRRIPHAHTAAHP